MLMIRAVPFVPNPLKFWVDRFLGYKEENG